MPLVEVTVLECTSCGKRYSADYHGICSCQKKNAPGDLVGPFRLLSKTEGGWMCECLLCTNRKEVSSSNLKRQKSCGCVPRYVEIQSLENGRISYLCQRCNQIRLDTLPVFEWCHSDE